MPQDQEYISDNDCQRTLQGPCQFLAWLRADSYAEGVEAESPAQEALELLQRVSTAEFGESSLGLKRCTAEELVDGMHSAARARRPFQQQAEALKGLWGELAVT